MKLNKLTLRISIPFLLIILLCGAFFVVFVFRTISRFTNEQRTQEVQALTRDISRICQSGYEAVIASESGNTASEVSKAQTQTLKLLEDFLKQNNLEGVVYSSSPRNSLLSTPHISELATAIANNLPQAYPVAVTLNQQKFYVYQTVFAPWGWQILFFVDAQKHTAIFAPLRQTFLLAGGLILIVLMAFLIYVDRTLVR